MYIITTITYHRDWKGYPNPIYRDFKGNSLREVMRDVENARLNNDCAKYEPLNIVNVVNTEEAK